ncbi:MAG: tetratricopeptide repeat protein [Candidatus Obscuribacterales bacterium]|nr:tetratricopeptide repeat protein [Candidatus Obscuribacterales bacterium]
MNLYQAGEYRKAISHIQEILDLEPSNWDARLMLAVCFYKTGQHGAAIRAFQTITERTNCDEIRAKSEEGLAVCTAKLERRNERSAIPSEFSCYIEVFGKTEPQLSWV